MRLLRPRWLLYIWTARNSGLLVSCGRGRTLRRNARRVHLQLLVGLDLVGSRRVFGTTRSRFFNSETHGLLQRDTNSPRLRVHIAVAGKLLLLPPAEVLEVPVVL